MLPVKSSRSQYVVGGALVFVIRVAVSTSSKHLQWYTIQNIPVQSAASKYEKQTCTRRADGTHIAQHYRSENGCPPFSE